MRVYSDPQTNNTFLGLNFSIIIVQSSHSLYLIISKRRLLSGLWRIEEGFKENMLRPFEGGGSSKKAKIFQKLNF